MDTWEKKIEFKRDVSNYLQVKYGIDLSTEIRYRSVEIRINRNEDEDYENRYQPQRNRHILERNINIKAMYLLVSEGRFINKRFIQWLIKLANEFYSLRLTYHEMISVLVNTPSREVNFYRRRYRWKHTVETPFRVKQKFVKNLAKLKDKNLSEHEKNKIEYRKFKIAKRKTEYSRSRYSHNPKRYDSEFKGRSRTTIINEINYYLK